MNNINFYTPCRRPSTLPPPPDRWYQKQRAFFNALDYDKNGNLTGRDKELIEKDFDAQPHGKKFRTRFHRKLDSVFSFLQITPKVSYDDFLQVRLSNLDTHRHTRAKYSNDPENKSPIKSERYSYFKLLFDLTNVNADKFWTEDEGFLFFQVMCRGRVSEEDARKTLQKMDRGERGKVSLGEFMIAMFDFEFEEDEGPFDLMFGPLPSVEDARPPRK